MSIFTFEQTAEIANEIKNGLSKTKAAEKYGVSRNSLTNHLVNYEKGNRDFFVTIRGNLYEIKDEIKNLRLGEIKELYDTRFTGKPALSSIKHALSCMRLKYLKTSAKGEGVIRERKTTIHGNIVNDVREIMLTSLTGMSIRKIYETSKYSITQVRGAVNQFQKSAKYNLLKYKVGKTYYYKLLPMDFK